MKISKIPIFLILLCLPVISMCGKDQTVTSNKNSVTNTVKVTFIELGSVNCIPCKMMQPVMKQIEEEYEGVVKVVFYDVWTSEQRSKAAEYGIRAIPTQVFLDVEGKEFFRHMGYFPVEEIEKILAKQGIEKKKTVNDKK